MKIKFLKSLILYIIFSVTVSSHGQEDPGKKYRIIYSLNAMQTTSLSEASAVISVLGDHLRKNFKQTFDIEIIICTDETELAGEMSKGFALTVLITSEFLNLDKKFPMEPAFLNETNGHPGLNYLLVTHKDDNITDISQLQGADLTIWAQNYQFTPSKILDKYLLDKKLPTSEKFFGKIIKTAHTNNVVLPVFFKKVKAAFVSEQQLNITEELNPQIAAKLDVIYNSPRLLLGLASFNKSLEPEMKQRLSDVFLNLHKDPFGRQLLDFFSSDKLIPFREVYMNDYLQFFK